MFQQILHSSVLPNPLSSHLGTSKRQEAGGFLLARTGELGLFFFFFSGGQFSNQIPPKLLLYLYQFSTGLVLLSRTIMAPTLEPNHEAVLTLYQTRKLKLEKHMTGFIGYDPIDGTYKALCMPYVIYPEARPKNSSNEPRVLTLGRSEQESSWSVIQGSFEHFPTGPSRLCINGVVYYESYLTSDQAEYCMMSFNVRFEKFKIIQVPWKECSRGKLLSYHGKLASVTCSSAVISLWVLEDAERHEWSFKCFTLPFPLDDPVLQKPLELAGVTHGGEFVYVPSGIHLLSRFHALYFDPLRNSFRRVVYEGIGDDEFWRRSGLGNEPLRRMRTLPNHVETLMSL